MDKKYGDIDWLNLRGDDGIQKTQALYRAFIDVAKRIGVTGDALLFQILGDAETGGTDYMRNFRAGKIAKFKAQTIHQWLVQNHFDQAKATSPELFQHPVKDAFQKFIDTHAIVGKLRIVRIKNAMCIVQRSDDRREHVETLRLSKKFCFELETEIIGIALAFQRHQKTWHPLPLGADQRRYRAEVKQGINLLPRTANGKPIPLEENDDAGRHPFAVIVSQNRMLSDNAAKLTNLEVDSEKDQVQSVCHS